MGFQGDLFGPQGHLKNCNSVCSCWAHFSALEVASLNTFFSNILTK